MKYRTLYNGSRVKLQRRRWFGWKTLMMNGRFTGWTVGSEYQPMYFTQIEHAFNIARNIEAEEQKRAKLNARYDNINEFEL